MMEIDPVCGMEVDEKESAGQSVHEGKSYYFCSQKCLDQFKSDPARYLANELANIKATEEVPGERHLTLPIEPESAASARGLEKELKKKRGVKRVSVNPVAKEVHITVEGGEANTAELVETIREAGYLTGSAAVVVPISGMTCASCVTAIERALAETPGVLSASVSLASEAAHVTYLPKKVDIEGLRRAIESAGYKVKPPPGPGEDAAAQEERERGREYRTLMRKFWFAAVLSIPIMALSYPDLVPGLRERMPMGSVERRVVWGLLGLLALPVMLWSGSQFFTGMWQALRHRSANMHTLIAIGISAAFLYSAAAVAFPQWFPSRALAEVFWDVTAVVVALVVLGLALEVKAKGKTSEAIRKLIGLQAKTARVIRDGREVDLPVEEVVVGDRVVVRPGGRRSRSTARWSRGAAPSTNR
jgi:Cu+-exporting ATPase